MLGDRKGALQPVGAVAALAARRHQCAARRNRHDISRYFIGLLVFLGLLGTFWGLLKTIGGVADALSTITRGSATPTICSTSSRPGLQAPLAGMGTAFSSSLFGLAGSLVLGFLELQASQAQNRFFNELEDWLSGQTRLSSRRTARRRRAVGARLYPGAAGADRRQPGQSAAHDVARRGRAASRPSQPATRWSSGSGADLTDQMRTEQQLMTKLAETPARAAAGCWRA